MGEAESEARPRISKGMDGKAVAELLESLAVASAATPTKAGANASCKDRSKPSAQSADAWRTQRLLPAGVDEPRNRIPSKAEHVARIARPMQEGANESGKTMAKPKDINELRDQLLDAFDWVRGDPRRANQVKEMTNAAGKILGTVKAQLEYAVIKGEDPEIPFLGKTSGKPLRAGAKLLSA